MDFFSFANPHPALPLLGPAPPRPKAKRERGDRVTNCRVSLISMAKRFFFLLLGLCLVLCGCTGGKTSVYVDVDAIVASEAPKREPSYKPPTPPAPMAGMNFTIPAEPERTVRDSGGQITTSIAEIEKIQKDAAQALNARLRALA